MPCLIVNADDLGLTGGVNRAIFHAQDHGIVTSATLMANSRAFAEAVTALQASVAYRNRILGVGCHIVLVDGEPLSSPRLVPTLIEGNAFRKKLWKFALAALRGKISVEEVELEASEQIRKLQLAGIELSHVDCHKHSHMFPVVLEGVLRAAANLGIRAIRNPFEPSFAKPLSINARNATRSAETALLRAAYAKHFLERVQHFGLATTGGSVGVTATGALDVQPFQAIVRSLPSGGTFEFVCHPGYIDADLKASGTRLLQSRETELNVLCSSTAREVLQSSRTTLINFWNIASQPGTPHPMA